MVAKSDKEAGRRDQKLLIIRDTMADGKPVRRGDVIDWPATGGNLLLGSANKAVLATDEALAEFGAQEAAKNAGSGKKPPKREQADGPDGD